jgi:dephospho-CoA kinase
MRKLIALAGKMGSGKTTIVEKLLENISAQKLAIANPLKEEIVKYKLTPDGVLNKSRDRNILQSYGQLRRGELESFFIDKGMVKKINNKAWILYSDTYEEECIGECNENYWINLTAEKIIQMSDKNILIDDVRRINEAIILKKLGFTIIKIACPEEIRKQRLLEKYGKVEEKLLNDISEIDIDNIQFDYTVINDKSLKLVVNDILNLI